MERIKLYQQFGFTIKEIQELMDAPKDVVRAALENIIQLAFSCRNDIIQLAFSCKRIESELAFS